MTATSGEYEEEESLEDQDGISELAGATDEAV